MNQPTIKIDLDEDPGPACYILRFVHEMLFPDDEPQYIRLRYFCKVEDWHYRDAEGELYSNIYPECFDLVSDFRHASRFTREGASIRANDGALHAWSEPIEEIYGLDSEIYSIPPCDLFPENFKVVYVAQFDPNQKTLL